MASKPATTPLTNKAEVVMAKCLEESSEFFIQPQMSVLHPACRISSKLYTQKLGSYPGRA